MFSASFLEDLKSMMLASALQLSSPTPLQPPLCCKAQATPTASYKEGGGEGGCGPSRYLHTKFARDGLPKTEDKCLL